MEKSQVQKIEVNSLDDIRHENRIQIIADLLISGKSRRQVIDELSQQWNCGCTTISTLIKETIVYLHQENEIDREHLRSLNLSRLDDIYGGAETTVEKLKTIDMINKTANLYNTNVNVATKDEIKIDLGI